MRSVTYFILWVHTETSVSNSKHRKYRERFGKNASERTGRVEISKFLAVSVACVAIY